MHGFLAPFAIVASYCFGKRSEGGKVLLPNRPIRCDGFPFDLMPIKAHAP
jgi:hypothetical protein